MLWVQTSSQAEAILVLLWGIIHLHPVFLVCQTIFPLFLCDLSALLALLSHVCFLWHWEMFLLFALTLPFPPSYCSVFYLPLLVAQPLSFLSSRYISKCFVLIHILTFISHSSFTKWHVLSFSPRLFCYFSFGHPELRYQENCPFAPSLCPLSKVLQPKQDMSRRSNIFFSVFFLIYSVSLRRGVSVNGLQLANLAPHLCDGWIHWKSANLCGRNSPGENYGWIWLLCVWTQLD